MCLLVIGGAAGRWATEVTHIGRNGYLFLRRSRSKCRRIRQGKAGTGRVSFAVLCVGRRSGGCTACSLGGADFFICVRNSEECALCVVLCVTVVAATNPVKVVGIMGEKLPADVCVGDELRCRNRCCFQNHKRSTYDVNNWLWRFLVKDRRPS